MMQRKTLSVHLNKYMAGKNKKPKSSLKNKKKEKNIKGIEIKKKPIVLNRRMSNDSDNYNLVEVTDDSSSDSDY